MTTQRNSKRLLLACTLALVFTVAAIGGVAHRWLSTRVTRWGNSLVVGPHFSGATSVDGGATQLRFAWENGSPVLDAPAWKGRGPFSMTFLFGFVIYHTPPGTLDPPPNAPR